MQVSAAAILTFFLVASVASANSGQQEQQPGLVSSVVSVSEQSQSVPVSVSSSSSHSAPVGVEVSVPVSGSSLSEQQAPQVVVTHHNHHPSVASYYAHSGSPIQVVGEQQSVNNKPVQVLRNFEQYGQPESASLPANYKPFGSWGLYIGGNQPDGYYTNYYKSLGSNVADKQVDQYVKPGVSQTAAFAPVLRQASSSPYTGSEYYPVAYSPAEFSSSVSRINSEPQLVHHAVAAVAHPQSSPVSPVQVGAQVHGTPATFDSNYASVSSYADAYATKKVGSLGGFAPAKGSEQKEVQLPLSGKGYQSRTYVYPVSVGQLSAPVQPAQAQSSALVPAGQQQQVVSYAVPVGSQIVGSQAGVEGAFAPYGVHAFTRYAVKPTLVSQDQSYYYNVYSPYVQAPAYKQSAVYSSVQQQPLFASYPFSYYGYPLSQLHYSQAPAPQYQYQYQAVPAPQYAPIYPSVPQQAAPEYSYQPVQYEASPAPAPAPAPAASAAPALAPAAPAQEKYEAPEPKYGVKI